MAYHPQRGIFSLGNNAEFIPTIELYKNPFKYLHPYPNNIFSKDDLFRDDPTLFFKIFDVKKCFGKNILGLSYITNLNKSMMSCMYSAYIDSFKYNIITALYLPEDFTILNIVIRVYSGMYKLYNIGKETYYDYNYIVKNPNITGDISLYNSCEDSLMEKYSWENILSFNKLYNSQKIIENQTDIFNGISSYNSSFNLPPKDIDGYTHYYNSPEIYMDGKRYIRIEPFKPYFLNKLFYGVMGIFYHKPIDMYIEFISNFRNTISYQTPLSNISDDIYFHNTSPTSELDENILKNKLCVNEKVCQEVDSMWYYNYIEENIEKINLIENGKILK